jgi:CRP-like cAMP-binding protein
VPTTFHLLGPYERLVLLKAMSLGAHPPAAALSALASHAVERQFAAGTRLTDGSTRWDSVHVVAEGQISVRQGGRHLYTAGPREVFGLLETLARVEADVEAQADVESLTLEIRATTLLSIMEDHHVIAQDTIQTMARLLLTTPYWMSRSLERRVHVPATVSPKGFDLVDRIRLLQTSGVFAHARVDSLAELASQYEEFHAEPGTVLWREGDPGGWFVVLLDGTVDSSSKAGLGFSWEPGMVPGLIDALAAAPRWHDARAATPLMGLRLSAERLFDALEDDFAMAADLLSALAVKVRQQRLAVFG